MLPGKPWVALVAWSLWFGAACGPSTVQLRPAQGCDGGKLDDCRNQCGQNVARACYRLGWFYEQGQHVERNIGQALKLYDQACSAGMAVACRALGMIYARGEEEAVLDRPRALAYYEKACLLGLEPACLTEKEKAAMVGRARPAKAQPAGGVSVEASVGP